jgi:type IV secretory pathway VirB10-like protein
MEIIIALFIVGVGLIWYFNAQRKKSETMEAAETAKPAEPVVITPSLNPMQSLPVTVAEPAPAPVEVAPTVEPAPVEVAPAPAAKAKPRKVGKTAVANAKAADKASKKATAAKKTPARKSGGKKVG